MDYLEQLMGEAEHHGSGSFTSDLSRMQQVLGSHQLADPEEFVLAIVSAAVLNGSSWFRLESARGLLRLHWSEPGLDVEQLHQLLPGLAHPGTMLSELAIGLLAARRLGAVSLQTPGGMVYFDGELLLVSDHCGEGNCLTLERRSWWQRFWKGSRPTASLLKLRARHAPLQVTPQPPKPQVAVGLALGTSNLPAHPISAHEWVQLPPNPWGEGIVYFAHSDWQLIRHGVSYLIPAPIPGVTALWWSDRLPLDLSRQYVVQGPEFKQWTAWLHDQLSELVLHRGLRQHFATLIASSRPSQLPTLLEAPIFRRADGNIACLRQIREEYLEHGWLPVVSYAMQIEWEPQRVLIVDHPHEKQLCTLFSNWINLDHLQGQLNLPRLPNPEEYLVRIPFLQGRGEAGLRRYPDLHGFREFIQGEVIEERLAPEGLDAAREGKGQGAPPLGELYWTLKLMKFSGPFEHLERYHFLQMFVWLRFALQKKFTKEYARRPPLEVLLDPKSQVQVSHCRGLIRARELREIADRLNFDSHSGEKIPLTQLCQSVRYLTVGSLTGPKSAVRMQVGEAIALTVLFQPGSLEESPIASLSRPITNTALKLLRGATSPAQLLRRLFLYRECSAHQLLRVAGLLDQFPELPESDRAEDLQHLVDRAFTEMRSEERELSTAYLLVALAEEPPLGLNREQLLPLLLEWAEYENIREHEELIFRFGADPKSNSAQILYRYYKLAWGHLCSGRWQEALELARTKLSSHPHKAAGLMLAGTAKCFMGDWEGGLLDFRQAAELEPGPSCATAVAEALLWLGRRDEAQAALPESEDQYTLMTRAQLSECPREQLLLAERIEQIGAGYYFRLAELRGKTYHQLGDYEKARQQLTRFLEARADNCTIYAFEERQQRARQLLQDCEGR